MAAAKSVSGSNEQQSIFKYTPPLLTQVGCMYLTCGRHIIHDQLLYSNCCILLFLFARLAPYGMQALEPRHMQHTFHIESIPTNPSE